MFPEIIQTKFFTLNTLWLFFGIALLATTYTLIKLSEKNGLKVQFFTENAWSMILISLVGARIFSIISNFTTFFYEFSSTTFFQIFKIWDKGLSIWGALIAFGLYLYYLCKKEDQNFFKWLDVLIPAMIIGFAIGHIGAFFEGIHYGSETSFPWGVRFENPSIKYTVPIHPTQIYAFLYATTLAIVLIMLDKLQKFDHENKPGQMGIIGAFAYTVLFFLEQFVRGDDTWILLGIRVPQVVSGIFAITIGIFIYLRYNKRRNKRHLTKKKNG